MQLCHYVHNRCDTSTYKEFNKLIDKFNYFVSGVKCYKNWSAWVTFANGFSCASSSYWLFLCDKIGKELERSFILLWCSSAAASVLGEYFSHVDLPGL